MVARSHSIVNNLADDLVEQPCTRELEATLIARNASAVSGHCFVNAFDREGTPVRLPPNEVNRYCNRAAVGLALSVEEGAISACAEYLLAGVR